MRHVYNGQITHPLKSPETSQKKKMSEGLEKHGDGKENIVKSYLLVIT